MYQLCIIPYALFMLLHVWGLQLATNMYSIARRALSKQKKAAPGNLKSDIAAIKRLNESKRKYKQYLKIKSREASSRNLAVSQPRTSRRKVALKERNIGSKNVSENSSYRKIQMLQSGEKSFRMSQEDVGRSGVEFFNYSKKNEDGSLPVSRRKNDVFKLSGRDSNNPEKLVQMKLFEQHSRGNSRKNTAGEVIIEEGTDDEAGLESGESLGGPGSDGREAKPKGVRRKAPRGGEKGKQIAKAKAGPSTMDQIKEDREKERRSGGASGDSDGDEAPGTSRNFIVNFGLFGRGEASGREASKQSIAVERQCLFEKEGPGEAEGSRKSIKTPKVKFLEDYSTKKGEFLNIKTLENSEVVPKENADFFNQHSKSPPRFDFHKKMSKGFSKKEKKLFTLKG